MAFWKVIIFLSLIGLIHSVISAVQYMKLHGEASSLPFDIALECIVVCLVGSFAFVKYIVSSYKWDDIRLSKAYSKVSMEQVNTRPDFFHFQTRAKALYPSTVSE